MPINDDKVKNDDSGSAAIVADDGDNQFEDIISDQENYGVRYRRRRRPGRHLATKKTTKVDDDNQHCHVDTAIVDDNDEESCDAQVDENWFDGDVDALKLTDDPRFVRGRLASESNERPKFDRLSVRLQWSIIRRRKRRQERHAIKDYFRQKVANLLQITNIDAIREQWLDQLCTCNANADLMDERQQMMLQKLVVFIFYQDTGCLKITAARLGLSFGAGMRRARPEIDQSGGRRLSKASGRSDRGKRRAL